MLFREEAVNSAYHIPPINSEHLRGADKVKFPAPLVILVNYSAPIELTDHEYLPCSARMNS